MRPLAILVLLLLLISASNARPTRMKSAGCSACTFLVNVLHNMWGDQVMEDCIGHVIQYVCQAVDMGDGFVCKAYGTQLEDIFDYVTKTLVVEPSEICGLLLPDCGTFVNPFTATWHLEMPPGKPPHKQQPPIQPGQPTLKVLHLTDIHIDMDYTPGLEANCSEAQCCRPLQDPNEITREGREPMRADSVKVPAGKWGTLGNCDAPYWLFTNLLDHIAATHKDLDYVVVSGDLESHAQWDYTRQRHLELIRNISDTIRSRLPSSLPILFAVGNHEAVPMDNFAPHWTPDRFHMDWLYGAMADAWKGWVPADQDAVVRFNGCYMRKLYPGLRLISLNTGYGQSDNFFLYINQTDPDQTLTWFMNQLWDAEKAGDKVQVVAHMPGVDREAAEGWAINYNHVINRFEDTVVAQFLGHTHSEEFNVFFEDPNDPTSRPTSVSWSAPSVTTNDYFYPAYRIYTSEGDFPQSGHRVIDWTEYYLDLNEANAHPVRDPEWKLLYPSVLQEYGIKDTSASEWSTLINRMATDNDLFEKFRKNYYRYTPTSSCGGGCRHDLLCTARQAHKNQSLCVDLPAKLGIGELAKLERYAKKPLQLRKNDVVKDFKLFMAQRREGRSDDDKCPF